MKLTEIRKGKDLPSNPKDPDFWKPFDDEGTIIIQLRNLTSLEGAPQIVQGNFWCGQNNLTSLVGAPKIIGGSFGCSRNKITNLHNIHKVIHEIGTNLRMPNRGHFICDEPMVQSHILGLCLIKGLKTVELEDEQVSAIMNKYLHDINMCQEALIEGGYPNLAKI